MKKLSPCLLIFFAASVLFGGLPLVWAQEGGDDTFTLEEIVVTSQKRTERL